jgi:hypothetical protein
VASAGQPPLQAAPDAVLQPGQSIRGRPTDRSSGQRSMEYSRRRRRRRRGGDRIESLTGASSRSAVEPELQTGRASQHSWTGPE